jgi:L-asparaginase
MKIKFVTTGGTIDKVYFDKKSQFEVGEPQILEILQGANITFEHEIISVLRKDSLEMTEADRLAVRAAIAADPDCHFVVTHGTDTMIQTAKALAGIPGKVIVLVGSMQPARFKSSDAVFNIGFAAAAVQTLPPGVYITINGRVFDPFKCLKNVELNRFEEL